MAYELTNVYSDGRGTADGLEWQTTLWLPGALSTTTVTTTSGIGRSDLLGGNKEELQASLKFITELLPNETVFYPGHGKKSTIGYEKANNPYIVQIYKLA